MLPAILTAAIFIMMCLVPLSVKVGKNTKVK